MLRDGSRPARSPGPKEKSFVPKESSGSYRDLQPKVSESKDKGPLRTITTKQAITALNKQIKDLKAKLEETSSASSI